MSGKLRNIRTARRLMLACLGLVSRLNELVPKDDRRILFYESGKSFPSDNTEALCSWLVQNDSEGKYKLAYCVSNPGPFLDTARCKTVGKIGGVLAYLRSKYVFYSYGGFRIKPARGQVVVNLWHGTPLKTIGKLSEDEYYRSEDLDDFSYLVTSSAHFVPIMASAFGCRQDKVVTWGYPRCDCLVGSRTALGSCGIEAGKMAVLWMPTYRSSKDGRVDNSTRETETGLPVLRTRAQLEAFDAWLSDMGIVVVLKMHGYAAESANFDGLKSVIVVAEAEIQQAGFRLYEFVACFDALLTDYSSIAFDYLLLDRPIGYMVDDMDLYRQKRGFTVEDPESLMPGFLIRDYRDLVGAISDVANDIDVYSDARATVRSQVWSYTDGFCRRVVESCGIEV